MFKFPAGTRVRKTGGDYTLDGTVIAAFKKKSGAVRYVMEADFPPGLLHIYSDKNLIAMSFEDSMSNVFIDPAKPDARQSDNPAYPVSRFRTRYRALTDSEVELHDAIKAKAEELERLFGQVKAGRYSALAVTALEQSIMWIIKGLTGD